jgi:hypothetical protein
MMSDEDYIIDLCDRVLDHDSIAVLGAAAKKGERADEGYGPLAGTRDPGK